jgi:hypothetical protein
MHTYPRPHLAVFLRFTDGAHAANGIVAMDFPPHGLETWEHHELRRDSFLVPPARQMLTMVPREWYRMDLQIRLSKDSTAESHPVGTLIDVQGFVGTDTTPDYPPKTVGTVRLNVRKAFEHQKGVVSLEEDDHLDDGAETVLEVLGYLKRRVLTGAHHQHRHLPGLSFVAFSSIFACGMIS